MPKNLKCKIYGLLTWLIFFACGLPITVHAGQTVDKVIEVEYAGTALLFAAIVAGAFTAVFIPTSVDSNIKHAGIAKVFIGLTFGFFATLAVSSYYKLDDVQMLLPAYFLASIGTPVMVYLVGIASDKETYAAITKWIKNKFGLGG